MPTSLAPLLIVDAPPAQPALFGLTASVPPTTVVDAEGNADERWVLGYDWDPQSCIAVTAQDPYSLTNLSDPLANPDSLVTTLPYMLELAHQRSTWGFQRQDYPERARRWLEDGTSKAIEAEFWTGSLGTGNQCLAASGVEVVGSYGPVRALAALEDEAASRGAGTRAVIHATPSLVTMWAAYGLVDIDGNRLVTRARGTIVISGAGYPGTGPEGANHATPETDHVWAYVTGLIVVRVSAVEMVPDEMAQALNRRTNDVTYRPRRYAAVNFDPCTGPAAVYVNLGT